MLSLPSLDDSLSSISTNSSTTLLPNNNSQYLSSNNSINDNSNIVRHQIYDYFSTKIPKSTIEMLFHLEKDERYLYFLRYGFLRRYEGNGDILYVEIPQIPKNIVIYRKPAVRNQNSEKLYLNKKDLTHIPLLEGEEYLKLLSLETNLISKIDHLISLNNLLFLNLYENRISEIENLHTVPKLKALMLGKNQITRIKNLNCLVDIEVLDLHRNKIKLIENLFSLKKLRILNLANNQITSFVELMNNKNLEDLNLRKNLIVSIPNLTYAFDKLKKINLGKNMIAKAEFVLEFKKLKKIEELYLEGNPVIYIKDAYKKFFNLPLKFKDAAQFQIYKNNSLNTNYNYNNNSLNHKKEGNSTENPENISEEEREKQLKKIEAEWNIELKYIINNGFNGYNTKKLKETKMQLCHAEIEREKQLNLFGNAIEVLGYTEFYNIVHTIKFEFINYDIVSQRQNIENIKKFTNLRSLIFNSNNLNGYYQLIKLENIKNIEYITIKKNEICFSELLKYFLIYRLQNIKYFNSEEITAKDMLMSRQIFENFDQAISFCENEQQNKKDKYEENGSGLIISKEVIKLEEQNAENKYKFYEFVKNNFNTALEEIFDL